MMGCRSASKGPEGCHAFAACPTASQKLQLRVHNDEGGMHPGIGLVREEIRCGAIFADVTAAIAECHGVFSLCLFAKHAELMRPGIAEDQEISQAGAPDLLLRLKTGSFLDVKARGDYLKAG
jgi:hypothetical protein